jgi:hypothetical protein
MKTTWNTIKWKLLNQSFQQMAEASAEFVVTAIYRKNFKPQIFIDITTTVKQSLSPDTGKVSVTNHASLPINQSNQLITHHNM